MNIAFKIPPAAHNYSDLHLIAEVGHNEISFLVFSKEPLILSGFYMYSLNRHISSGEYTAALEKTIRKEHVLHQQFASVNIFSNHNESTLIPEEFFKEEDKEKYCDLLFGSDKTAPCFREDTEGTAVKNIYRVPGKVYEILRSFFPGKKLRHTSSMQLNRKGAPANELQCIVYHNGIKVLLFKEGAVQIIQYFEYEVPADVCYHLLNICERFAISPGSVHLSLSGMVDEHSNLYREIYNYFEDVHFMALPAGTKLSAELNEHPHQFYSHLSALAACV